MQRGLHRGLLSPSEFLCVRLSVCHGCGRGHNEFEVRVQNYHVRSSSHRTGYNVFK